MAQRPGPGQLPELTNIYTLVLLLCFALRFML